MAIPKPKKPVKDPKSYLFISLLCVPYKILERLIHARVEPIVGPLFLGSRMSSDTEGQPWIRLLCPFKISRVCLRPRKKVGAVFFNLTAAYDTVWHRDLICRLLRLLPDKHMVRMIIEFVRNRSFTLTTRDSKQSRLRR